MTDYTQIADRVLARVLEEWRNQGHDLTKKVENTAKSTIEQTLGFVRITGELEYYARFVNHGLVQNEIPYSLPSGRGGTSKYIEGLIAFATKLGKNEKEAKGMAFAIAHTHLEEGMPTSGSMQYSSTGSRTQFVENAFKDMGPELNKLIFEEAAGDITKMFTKILTQIVDK